MANRPENTEAREVLVELTGQMLAWLEDAADLGVTDIPLDTTPRVVPGSAVPQQAPSLRAATKPPRPRPPTTMPEIRVEAPRPSVARSTPATGSVELDAIRSELGDCTRCALSERRRNIVFGVGSPEARLVIVGEAPGRDEDMTGIPFVGRAGQLLTRMLAAIGMAREDAYICNVLKCRPPGNRDPEPQEIATCSPFMGRQVDAIAPKVVLTVGKFASQMVTGLDQRMGQMRGKVFDYRSIPVVPTYHPAYLLRNPSAKGDAYRDLLTVQRLLRAG